MSDFRTPYAAWIGRPAANEDEMEEMRRVAWRNQGVLSVKLCDRRLTTDEQDALKEIAERLYGYRREDR